MQARWKTCLSHAAAREPLSEQIQLNPFFLAMANEDKIGFPKSPKLFNEGHFLEKLDSIITQFLRNHTRKGSRQRGLQSRQGAH